MKKALITTGSLVGLANDAVAAFGFRGHVVLQAFVAPNGTLSLIECNPRVGGASALAFAAGLESPSWMLQESRGLEVAPRVGSYRRGLRLIRHAADRIVSI